MGVAVREDGGTVGVFSPKKVSEGSAEGALETPGAQGVGRARGEPQL